jgi:branched-chain amino acid transport system substrate-binding protein
VKYSGARHREFVTHWDGRQSLLSRQTLNQGASMFIRIAYRATSVALLAAMVLAVPCHAQKKYGPGASDKEIKLGQTMPYSGPLSVFGTIGRAEAAYFEKLNAAGGINGRRINLISLDDGYAPPRTVEQTRKLVEQEEVLALFSSVGTPTNAAIQRYVNAKKVPHLFLSTGASRWGDPQQFPWTMGWAPNYLQEGGIYAKYILKNYPRAKIAVLYQNDDFGKDFLRGFQEGLGDNAKLIVALATYEPTDPTVDSQITTLKASGADTFFDIAAPKAAAQAIRKAYEIGWRPLHFLQSVAASIASTLKPAGLDHAVGVISSAYYKDPNDPQWANDPAVLAYLAWMKLYYPAGNPDDVYNVWGYSQAQTIEQVLKQCADDLTRENVIRQAANLKDLQLPMLLQGIKINTSPTDYYPIKHVQLMKFDGRQWVRFGEIMGR